MYAVIPTYILLNKSISPIAKILYGYISSVAGKTGRYKFTLHHFSLILGVPHYTIKLSLNELAKEKFIWRIGEDISLYETDEEKDTAQMELEMEFAKELIREWNSAFKTELPKGIVQTAALTGAIYDCLNVFSKDDLYESVGKWHDYCVNDKWWGKDENKMHRANAFKFFSNPERITQAMNWKVGAPVIQAEKEAEDSGLLN